MKLQIRPLLAALMLAGLTTVPVQTQEQPKPKTEARHFAKDGLSFDYPANWNLTEQSNSQMQVIELLRGDHMIRVRSPREWLKTPAKEAEARRLIQDKYVDDFVETLRQGGLNPNRTTATTEFAGGPAEGLRVRARLGGALGGMDSYYRVISDRFVQLSQIGSEQDMASASSDWDMIRNSLQIEAPAIPTTPPAPTPTPEKRKP